MGEIEVFESANSARIGCEHRPQKMQNIIHGILLEERAGRRRTAYENLKGGRQQKVSRKGEASVARGRQGRVT
jgi:hypothetical protein